LSHSGKLFANVNVCTFLHTAYGSISRGVTKGQGGAITRAPNHSEGAEILRGHQKIPTMSYVHSSIQYICFRKTSGSKMGAPNLHLAPGAI